MTRPRLLKKARSLPIIESIVPAARPTRQPQSLTPGVPREGHSLLCTCVRPRVSRKKRNFPISSGTAVSAEEEVPRGGRKRSMSDQKGAKVLSQAGLLDLILGPICLRKQLVATSVISLELRAGSRGGKKSEKGGSRGGAISPLKTHYLLSSRDTF